MSWKEFDKEVNKHINKLRVESEILMREGSLCKDLLNQLKGIDFVLNKLKWVRK